MTMRCSCNGSPEIGHTDACEIWSPPAPPPVPVPVISDECATLVADSVTPSDPDIYGRDHWYVREVRFDSASVDGGPGWTIELRRAAQAQDPDTVPVSVDLPAAVRAVLMRWLKSEWRPGE